MLVQVFEQQNKKMNTTKSMILQTVHRTKNQPITSPMVFFPFHLLKFTHFQLFFEFLE